MNAPWKPGVGLRDPFHAFVCDDHSFDVLRAVAAEMGWAPEKVNKGGMRNAVQTLSITASPQILFVDMSESGDPLSDINALAEVCEPGTVVIAIGQVNDVRLYRDLLASGIHDYLLKPLSANALRDALTQAQAVFMAPRGGEEEGVKHHVSTAVIGTRGGVGASTLVTSLAWIFSTEKRMPTALLDLDVHFGTGALTLDLEPGRGLTDAIDNPSRIDGLFIERAMVRASDTLAILSAEAPIHQPVMTDGSAFFQLEEELRNAFEMTIVDIPRQVLIPFPHLVSEAGTILLVSDVTLAAARDTIRRGAFARTLAERREPIPLYWQHSPDRRIGWVDRIGEDTRGLRIEDSDTWGANVQALHEWLGDGVFDDLVLPDVVHVLVESSAAATRCSSSARRPRTSSASPSASPA